MATKAKQSHRLHENTRSLTRNSTISNNRVIRPSHFLFRL